MHVANVPDLREIVGRDLEGTINGDCAAFKRRRSKNLGSANSKSPPLAFLRLVGKDSHLGLLPPYHKGQLLSDSDITKTYGSFHAM